MLLSRKDVDARRPAQAAAHHQVALSIAGKVAMRTAAPGETLQECLPELLPEQLYTMPCHATWSMHHLLKHVLQLIGPSRVMLCSWTITPRPVETVVNMVDEGLITELGCVFDKRAWKNNVNAAQIAQKGIARIAFTEIHAKCIVAMNERHVVTVCPTANLTRNKRIELYWISTHAEVATQHWEWLERILDECSNHD